MERAIRLVVLLVSVFALTPAWAQSSQKRKTDAEIKQEVISQSVANYPGSCPCSSPLAG